MTLLMLIIITCITFPGHYYAQSCWNMCFVLDRLELLKKLTAEAMYIEAIRKDHWLWVYDNFNMHERVRHEREGTHMLIMRQY